MNIGIDLDDTTVSIIPEILEVRNSRYHTKLTIHDHITYDLTKVWNCTPQEVVDFVYEFYRSEFMDKLPPLPGAVESIHRLSQDYTLSFITSRPDFLREKTEEWIKKYFQDTVIPVYFTNQFQSSYSSSLEKKVKKSDICKALGITMIIDDAPAYAYDCASENIAVLLYDQPWNKEIPDTGIISRVRTWEEVMRKIEEKHGNKNLQ